MSEQTDNPEAIAANDFANRLLAEYGTFHPDTDGRVRRLLVLAYLRGKQDGITETAERATAAFDRIAEVLGQ